MAKIRGSQRHKKGEKRCGATDRTEDIVLVRKKSLGLWTEEMNVEDQFMIIHYNRCALDRSMDSLALIL